MLTFARDTGVTWGQLIEAKCDLISVELLSPNEKCHYAAFFRIEISNDTSPEVLMSHFLSLIIYFNIPDSLISGLRETGMVRR